MLGDCDLWEKFVPHQPSIGIPLIVAGPGVARGRTTDQPVTFLDLHATISEIAGAAPIAGIDSRSMLPTLADPGRRHRELVFSGLGTWRIVFDGHYKLIAGYDPAVTRQAMETGSFDPAAIASARLVDTSLADCETGDISAGHPEIARRLAAAMRENCNRARARAAPQPAE
jgi:arylsulfatase A-like enzyme